MATNKADDTDKAGAGSVRKDATYLTGEIRAKRIAEIMAMADKDERQAAATNYLTVAFDKLGVSKMMALFNCGATITNTSPSGKFFDFIISNTTGSTSYRSYLDPFWALHYSSCNEKYWILLKMAFHHGLKFDDSAASYKCLYYYLFDALTIMVDLLTRSYAHIDLQAKLVQQRQAKQLELISDLQLFISNGTTTSSDDGINVSAGTNLLSKVLQDPTILSKVFSILRAVPTGPVGAVNDLLKFLLEHGLNPSYTLYEADGKFGHSFLTTCLKYETWDYAALLLEYGADYNDSIPVTIAGTRNRGARNFPNLRKYLDCQLPPDVYIKASNRAERAGISADLSLSASAIAAYELPIKRELLRGLDNLRKRREEIYPLHLKLAMEQTSPDCLSFDVKPLTTIISEYIL